MIAPVIGLTTYREQAAWGVWHQRADLLPAEYAGAVESVGGVPLLLPPVAAPGAAQAVVGRLDGLVISGGADVDPARYGADVHPHTSGWRGDRDAWEIALLDAADAVDLPVLGVCRGMQLMAVRAGGTLDQLGAALVVDVADDDLRARLDEPLDGGQADARATAGDDRAPVLDASCHEM